MALVVDHQPQQFKHYCRICKKGFTCGTALGGHMRAHGIGDDNEQIEDDDDDHASDWEAGNAAPPANKRMYALRTNPNRLKSCRYCENCGEEFSSWKSFLEHGKCTTDDAESLVSSPCLGGEDEAHRRGYTNWSKRKRSSRGKVGSVYPSNCPSNEEEDLAHCLMMLSNAAVDHVAVEPEESCASASKEEERRHPLNFLSTNTNTYNKIATIDRVKGMVPKGLFECKACKKVFNSHQALGGHRASHKKVKGCFAAKLENLNDNVTDEMVVTPDEFFSPKSNSTLVQYEHGSSQLGSNLKRKSKVHECSICHRVFSSGQALGGHKRCHWIASNNSPDATSSMAMAKFSNSSQFFEHHQTTNITLFKNPEPLDLTLDLNLPAPTDNNNNVNLKTPGCGVPPDIFLQPWVNVDAKDIENENNNIQTKDKDDNKTDNKIECDISMNNIVDDEAHSKVKLSKLSEMQDMSMGGCSSPWLQVGLSTDDKAVVVGADGGGADP